LAVRLASRLSVAPEPALRAGKQLAGCLLHHFLELWPVYILRVWPGCPRDERDQLSRLLIRLRSPHGFRVRFLYEDDLQAEAFGNRHDRGMERGRAPAAEDALQGHPIDAAPPRKLKATESQLPSPYIQVLRKTN